MHIRKLMSDASTIKQYSLLFLGIIILLSILIFIYSQFTLKEMKYKRNQEEIETYYEYTLKIEAINNEMRKSSVMIMSIS